MQMCQKLCVKLPLMAPSIRVCVMHEMPPGCLAANTIGTPDQFGAPFGASLETNKTLAQKERAHFNIFYVVVHHQFIPLCSTMD